MKVELKKENKIFEPIEIKLVIENEKELCDLWHRMNGSKILFKDDSLKHPALPANGNENSFFTILDDLIALNNLKKNK